MGFFDISVSCFDDCHIIKFGCCCGCLSVIKTIYQTIIFEQIFFAHNNNYYIIVQGQGGIKGWDLILHIVYLSSRLYVRAVEYFSHIEHNNANTCGGTPGGNVDTHSPILPRNLHYTYHTLSCSLLLNSDLFHAHVCIYLAYIYQGC